jgi:hypothetical protein
MRTRGLSDSQTFPATTWGCHAEAIGCGDAAHRRARRSAAFRRRALELLADAGPGGCTEAVMLAHGFTIGQMVDLVRAGLATATPQRVKAGREQMEVATLRITDAGRKALGEGKGMKGRGTQGRALAGMKR